MQIYNNNIVRVIMPFMVSLQVLDKLDLEVWLFWSDFQLVVSNMQEFLHEGILKRNLYNLYHHIILCSALQYIGYSAVSETVSSKIKFTRVCKTICGEMHQILIWYNCMGSLGFGYY